MQFPSLEETSLPQLIEGCRAADRRAQEHIFRSYYSDFGKICLRYAGDRQEADAMLSDAFFRIFTRIESYNGTGCFEAWMRRIVVNTCLSHLRSNRQTASLPAEDTLSDGHSGMQESNEALSRLGIRELTGLIQRLPPVSRTVFNLYIFEGYTHKEIAAHLGISEGTSHWHLSTARRWLQSKL